MLLLLYLYHGFLVYNSDTIETVPYALWLADNSLFLHDFHLSYLRETIPNERWIISYILHFFPSNIPFASYFFHGIFSIILVAGMLRFADMILKNFEFAVLSVFITLFSLYAINIGGNELYYNMFVPSLASKSIGIWACIYYLKNNYYKACLFLIISTFLHPLVGFQLFILFSAILFINKSTAKEKIIFNVGYLLSAGLFIGFILYNQFNSNSGVDVIPPFNYYKIIEYRIGHHFIPFLFPIKSIVLFALLYISAIIYYYKNSGFLFYFFSISLFGMLVYIIGVYAQIEFFLSSQWMKINIWLKFFSILAFFGWVQTFFEQKHYRLIVLVGFVVALGIAIIRFSPTYDPTSPTDVYSWVAIHSDKDDVFLVPPDLLDFKAKTLRSTYFDYKAMLHHKPAIFFWADRFEEVYGIHVNSKEKPLGLSTVSTHYLNGVRWKNNHSIDYIIVEKGHDALIKEMESLGKNLVFLGEEYVIVTNKIK